MTDVLLITIIFAVFCNVYFILSLRRYLRRVDRRNQEYFNATKRQLEKSQLALRKLAFHENANVHFLIQALQSNAPETDHELSSSTMWLVKKLDISWPVKSSSDIVICTVALGAEYCDVVSPCLDSHKSYAQRHGYQYAILERGPISGDRPYAWMKLPLILRLLQDGAKRILYIDADAMITNQKIPLEVYFEQFENRADMFLTEEAGGVNSGIIFIANTAGSRRILELNWLCDVDVGHPTWEQNALRILMDDFPEVRSRILVEPNPKLFNSFPVERRLFIGTNDELIWTDGDFICHFCAIRSPALEKLVRDYARKIAQRNYERDEK